MVTGTLDRKQERIIAGIPPVSDFSGIYFYTINNKSNHELVMLLDSIVGLNDSVLSDWLNITPRTYRNYKQNTDVVLKGNVKEHIVLLLSLYKHGVEVFGNTADFEHWLTEKNRLLDNEAPYSFLTTVSGIKFIDNRLTALEYGENV